jgi:hypothetical protein
MEMTERRGGRRKQLLDDLKKTIGFWKLNEESVAVSLARRPWARWTVRVQAGSKVICFYLSHE